MLINAWRIPKAGEQYYYLVGKLSKAQSDLTKPHFMHGDGTLVMPEFEGFYFDRIDNKKRFGDYVLTETELCKDSCNTPISLKRIHAIYRRK